MARFFCLLCIVLFFGDAATAATPDDAAASKFAFETLSVIHYQASSPLRTPGMELMDNGLLANDANTATITNYMVDQNMASHNTQGYQAEQLHSGDKTLKLILRRAASFQVTMSLPTSVNENSVQFTLGSTACPTTVTQTNPSGGQKLVTFQVAIPSSAPIGRATLGWNGQQFGDIIVLFNPWSADDTQVYMPTDSDRQEYVLRGDGRLWLGSVGKCNFHNAWFELVWFWFELV
jgi:hypothetical protein